MTSIAKGSSNSGATEERVQINATVAKSVDRALELEAAKRDIAKRQLVEVALRKFLGLPEAA